MDRRHFLQHGALAAAALAGPGRLLAQPVPPLFDPIGPIMPIRAIPDRLFRVTVCLRPFRAAGPRIESEQVGRKLVVHNYGHGGSGWSLSWGSAQEALRLAMAASPKEIAVIGAGALGLTAAIMAQRAGLRATIYAKERFPEVRSARATGSWTPDSRVAMANAVGQPFADQWSRMAHGSYAMWQSYVGLPGDPVEWTDRYTLSDLPPDEMRAAFRASEVAGFAHYSDLIADITPRSQVFGPGSHPFATRYALRNSQMTFNVAGLAHLLTDDFLAAGGRIETAEFHHPSELGRLREKVIVNCTGYGARALFRDESIVPVRGQIAWLLPQAGVNYGLLYRNVSVLGRRDGIVVQDLGADDRFGFNDPDETPDRAAADASVRTIAELFGGARTS
ncbi:FAD-dependent oxidoreductase [Rhizorhabdus dicambivorans]|uniref:D-amino-acid oxidase n=1 Tax=Rhizorhabdus dicambivorans TaxID=1850238 RepID=A0A2A4FZU5_9SPHN|nr:FAD-dependent oxidoreductase [Rhizorhabdus dicambivorans]ATE63080.1 FAD-binding oxidoreductase [Rhizorhabdus dicambivorans]PCE43257.1 FAD-binding oxidoreductase [Rhizorhabdus dicambivorans]